MFFQELVQLLFPKPTLKLYADDVPSTEHYYEVSERSKAWWDRADIDQECGIGKPRPSLYIDYFADGPMILNVEIGWKRKGKNAN